MDSPKRHEEVVIDMSQECLDMEDSDGAFEEEGILGEAGGEEEQRIPFFGPISEKNEKTWVISVFFFMNLLAFVSSSMFVCWPTAHWQCSLIILDPLEINPLLIPSPSLMDQMGALDRKFLTNSHGIWRLFISPFLYAGAFHFIMNWSSVVMIGVNLERRYGPWRTGIIYLLSAFVGSLMAALFVQNSPVICSSGALFGLLGASFSGLLRDWSLYSKQFVTVFELLLVLALNFALGILPYVDNFSSIAGFVSGFLLGFITFYSPQRKSASLKEKLDKCVLRSISLLLFAFMVCGLLVAFINSDAVLKGN